MNNKPISQEVHLFCAFCKKIPTAMRMTLLFLFAALFQLQANNSYSQNTKISLDIKNSSIEKILQTIEEKSEFYFLYNSKLIDVDRKADIQAKEESISSVLNRLFNAEDVEYEVKGTQIILHPKEMNRIASELMAGIRQQKRAISGKITDQQGEPIIGANIVEKGTTNGTVTDIDGNFSLQVGEEAVVQITYIGYLEQEIPATSTALSNIMLIEDTRALDELVVIGYGVVRKSDLTGSVASVKSESLEKFPTSNVTEMLRGQAPGIQVTLNTAAPGGGSDILVRGKRSLSSSQSPLYIVDGMIVPHINDLNSNDVSSIEILKDASSQAIYGSRASNGVILISTKRGVAGKTQVDINSYIGFQTYHRNFDMYSPEEWVTLRFWAKYNEGMAESVGTIDNMNVENVLDDAIMYRAYQDKSYTNWEELMLGNALQHKHDLSIRGGSNSLKYSASLGYYDQDGVVKSSGYNRGTFRSNIDYTPYKWLDLGTNFSYTKDGTRSADGNFNEIITMPVLAQAFDENGEMLREIDNQGDINPLWRNREYSSEVLNEYLMLSAYLNIKPFKDLSYRFDANIRSNNRETGSYRTKLRFI